MKNIATMNDSKPIDPIFRTWTSVRHMLCALVATFVIAATGTASAAILDGNEDFKLLASLGFEQALDGAHAEGSRLNDYAWSMQWFKGKLYVGTLRFQGDGTISTLPELTGQIWVYTPGGPDGASGTWRMVLQSPQGIIAPREAGYRWMTVCNFNGTDYMFVSTVGFLQGNILRTTDGETFTPLSQLGYPLGTVGFRTMVCFTDGNNKPMLVTTPVGKAGDAQTYDTDASDNPIVIMNDNPTANGIWRNYSPLRMNDPANNAFFTLYVAGGALYAGVNNDVTGAQVWKTTGCKPRQSCSVPEWTKVVDRGAGRPLDPDNGTVQNVGISDIMAFGGWLYMGVAVPTNQKPPAEMWRLRMSDNRLEVVVGDPRLNFGSNPDGVSTNPAFPTNLRCALPLEDIDGVGGANDCPPGSRRGGGFGDVSDAAGGYPPGTQSYFWRLLNYAYHAVNAPLGDNRLYAGTLQGGRSAGTGVRGFDMMASVNGLDWTVITSDGLGDAQNLGMRTIAASPLGLFIGSATRSQAADPSGCSVWLGIAGVDPFAPVTTLSTPSPDEGSTVNSHSVSFAWTATDTPGAGSLPLVYASRLDPLEPAFSAFGAAISRNYTSLPNGTYTFHVIAKDNAGNTEAPGAAPGAANRRTFTVNAPDLPPTVSIQVSPASPNTSGNVTFGWQGSDDVTPAANLLYDFWLAPPQSDTGTFVAATSANYTNLADGPYVFHVLARDGANNVGPEATVAFTVAKPPAPPTAPSPATATVIAPRTVRAAWTDVANELTYNVQRCTLGRFCTYAAVASNLPAGTTLFDDALGAGPPLNLQYRVQACNSLGCSAWVLTPAVVVP